MQITEEGKFPKDHSSSYIRKHKINEIGWFIFKATDLALRIREGRFKNILFRIPKDKPPPNPKKKLDAMDTALDFTIEIFEYTSHDKQLFSFRRRKKIPPELKK